MPKNKKQQAASADKDPVRDTALHMLFEIETKGSYSNLSMVFGLGDPAFSPLDRSFISQLVYGTIRWRLTLDSIIGQFSDIRIERLSPWILNILRMGIFQLLFLDSVPGYAACSESVRLARIYGHRGSVSYVNAMMRNIVRNIDRLDISGIGRNMPQRLSIAHSYPQWLVMEWAEQFGAGFAEELLAAGNTEPPFTIRLSCVDCDSLQIKAKRSETADILKESGISVRNGNYLDETLIVEQPSEFVRTEYHRTGAYYIQDEAAMLVSRILSPLPGEFVIDVCSAPGGKTTHIAELMGDNGTVLARDIHKVRLELVRNLAVRLGLNSIRYQVWDAEQRDPEFAAKADKVLVDAPCTGLGILRRKPEIKWRRSAEDMSKLACLQGRILDASSELVKPGGVLVYSVCTINRHENEDTVLAFLERNKGFRLSPEGCIRLFPHIDGTDGFFIARMVRLYE